MYPMLRCGSCAFPLDRAFRWARFASGEPESFVCATEYGYTRFEFGLQEVTVRCSYCGEVHIIPRNQALAAA